MTLQQERVIMKVSEFATAEINRRPYKYQTRISYLKDLKRLGIWEMDTSEIHSALRRRKVNYYDASPIINQFLRAFEDIGRTEIPTVW